MDNSTMQGQEPRSTNPARFARMLSPGVKNKRRMGEVIGSGLALFALLFGLPAALLVLSGPPPVPTGLPSLRDLVQQLSFEDLLTVLVVVVWLTWLYFVVCVVVEVVAARRGGISRSVPLAGPLQRLAQVLVGALLMSGLLAAPAQASLLDAANAAPTGSVATATVSGGPQAESADTAVDAQADGTGTAGQEQNEAHTDDGVIGKKVYTVTAPKDGYHDNLWDIAERHLGDGRRYTEIYQLNKDRAQPDGRQLELARLIQPGWDLVMPDDAVGVARVHLPDPLAKDALGVTQLSEPGASASGTGTAANPQVLDTLTSESDSNAPWITGIGLLAAGVIGALALQRRRLIGRRPDDDALNAESEFRIAATLARSSWLDRSLRELAQKCQQYGVAPPPVYAALVDDDSIELLLAPAMPEAVEGWTMSEEGRRWRRERGSDAEVATSNEVAPYPALTSLGVDTDGRDVLVDLEAAGGVVSVSGDPMVAEEVLAAIAIQCATSAWSDAVQVTAIGLPSGIAEVGDERIHVIDDLRAELSHFEQIAGLRKDVLTGRMSRRGFVQSHLLVCGRAPEPDLAERLGALVGSGRQALAVVVAGEHKSARWRLHVDEHGALSVPQLNLTVMANRISPAQVEAVAELFEASREPDRPDDGDRVRIPQPLHSHDDSVWTTALRRIGVLGKVAVQGAGELPADRSDLATELVTYLAMYPKGVHLNVLGGVLWPRGVTADVRDATIDRARQWLGTDPGGSHFLRTDAGGRLSLADSVVCDWDCARTLFISARRSRSSTDEADLLRRALKLVRGEVFDGVPEGRYGWIAHDDVARTMARVVVDGAHRLSQLLNGSDDPVGAAEAAEAGLRISPGSQLLWRELMRSRYAESGVAGVRRTLDQMSEALRGISLEPETEALAEELLPATGSLATGG